MKKVLFLDFDGPLWSDRVIRYHPHNDHRAKNRHSNFEILRNKMIENGDSFIASCLTYWRMDETAVGMLNKLHQQGNFQVVVSSSWRELCTKETIEYIFFLNNLRVEFHPDWMTRIPTRLGWEFHHQNDRLGQIVEWLSRHKDDIADYAILDDPGSGGMLTSDKMCESAGVDPKKVVLVNYEVGMEIDHFLTLQELLT